MEIRGRNQFYPVRNSGNVTHLAQLSAPGASISEISNGVYRLPYAVLRIKIQNLKLKMFSFHRGSNQRWTRYH